MGLSNVWRSFFIVLLGGLIAACGSSGSGGGGSPAQSGNNNNGGNEEVPGQELIVTVFTDAEDLVFDEAGRLFVSTREQVYEILPGAEAETLINQALAETGCHFGGLATAGGYLYAVCQDGSLFAGLIEDTPVLREIYDFTGMCRPNRIVVGPDGSLYVVDGPVEEADLLDLLCLAVDPKIVRLNLDPDNPLSVVSQETWLDNSLLGGLLGGDDLLLLPNGLTREGNIFYGTDGGSVYSVEWLPGGGVGEIEVLFSRLTTLGGLAVIEEGILVTDTLGGTVMLLSREGELLAETTASLLSGPGSVALGMAPLFSATDLLVTELPTGTDDGDGPLPITLDGVVELLLP